MMTVVVCTLIYNITSGNMNLSQNYVYFVLIEYCILFTKSELNDYVA